MRTPFGFWQKPKRGSIERPVLYAPGYGEFAGLVGMGGGDPREILVARHIQRNEDPAEDAPPQYALEVA